MAEPTELLVQVESLSCCVYHVSIPISHRHQELVMPEGEFSASLRHEKAGIWILRIPLIKIRAKTAIFSKCCQLILAYQLVKGSEHQIFHGDNILAEPTSVTDI